MSVIRWIEPFGPKDNVPIGFVYSMILHTTMWNYTPEIPWHGRLFIILFFLLVWDFMHIRLSNRKGK